MNNVINCIKYSTKYYFLFHKFIYLIPKNRLKYLIYSYFNFILANDLDFILLFSGKPFDKRLQINELKNKQLFSLTVG
jgi:hypothetical protein